MAATRQLGLWSATALVVASMVGSGVFTTSGFLLRDLGDPKLTLAGWLCGGILAALGALCYGALAERIPESGGEYRFLSDTLHPAAGYVAGLISLLVGFSAPLAAVAYGFGSYANLWLGGISPQASGSLLILAFAVLHALDVKTGAGAQNLVVAVKLLLIGGFIIYGLSRIDWGAAPSVKGEFSLPVFAVSLVWISFSYSGWNAAVYVGGEVKNPQRNLPLALLLGAGAVTVLYLGLNAVFVFSAPPEALAGKVEVARIAAEALGGKPLAHFVTALIVLALATSASSLLMAGPRVYAQAARDGYLPGAFEGRGGPPRWSIGLQAVAAWGLLWSMRYEALLTYIGFTLSLSTAATVAGLARLRLREGASVRAPGWPWVPAIFLAATLGIGAFTIWQRPWESLFGFGTVALGLAMWRWLPRRDPEEKRMSPEAV